MASYKDLEVIGSCLTYESFIADINPVARFLLIPATGDLYMKGINIGLDKGTNIFITIMNDVKIVDSYVNSIVIKNDGTVWVTGGANKFGGLGTGDYESRHSFTQIYF